MPHARFKAVIDADYDQVSALLVDKVEHPRKYVGRILHSTIEERGDGFVRRSMYEPPPVDLTVREIIRRRELPTGEEYVYEHVDSPDYTGTFRNVLSRVDGRDDQVELEYAMDWTPLAGTVDKIGPDEADGIVRRGVLHMKELAARTVAVPRVVSRFYAAIDAKTPRALATVLTENCHFRFGNAPEVVGRDAVIAVNEVVLSHFAAIRHDFEDVRGDATRVYAEAWVHYEMPDGARYLLPFLSVFDLEGESVAGLRVFGDPSPLTRGWEM